MVKEHAPWRDEETLRQKYWDEQKSCGQIGEELGCSSVTISRWMRRHDIDRRITPGLASLHEQNRQDHASFYHMPYGYETWSAKALDGSEDVVYVHRLLAVAEYGFDAVKDNEVHHKNEIPWDNRPANIEVMSKSEHKKMHVAKQPRNEGGELQPPNTI